MNIDNLIETLREYYDSDMLFDELPQQMQKAVMVFLVDILKTDSRAPQKGAGIGAVAGAGVGLLSNGFNWTEVVALGGAIGVPFFLLTATGGTVLGVVMGKVFDFFNEKTISEIIELLEMKKEELEDDKNFSLLKYPPKKTQLIKKKHKKSKKEKLRAG